MFYLTEVLLNILFVGDIVGNPGRKALRIFLLDFLKKNRMDFCIANCENAAGGFGITLPVAKEFLSNGIDVITMGNHTWSKKEALSFIDSEKRIIRPANFPTGVPGSSSALVTKNNMTLGVVNLVGRVFMDPVDCPFQAAEREVTLLKRETRAILVDMHAEATSEKLALAWHLDGKVSCVAGTHTHVQTSDERILPCGTAYITDVGMTGPRDGILGMNRDTIIKRFITGIQTKFDIAAGQVLLNAIYLKVDEKTGRAETIERINTIIKVDQNNENIRSEFMKN